MTRSDDFLAIRARTPHLIFDLTPTPLGGSTLTGPWIPIPVGNIPGGVHIKTGSDAAAGATCSVDYSNDITSDAEAVKDVWKSDTTDLTAASRGCGFTPLTGYAFMRLRRTDAGAGYVTATVAWGC